MHAYGEHAQTLIPSLLVAKRRNSARPIHGFDECKLHRVRGFFTQFCRLFFFDEICTVERTVAVRMPDGFFGRLPSSEISRQAFSCLTELP
jgi:hypothetical protein